MAELKINKDALTGEYTFWMQNETKIKWRSNPQAHERAEAYLKKLKQAKDDLASQSTTSASEQTRPLDASQLEAAIESQTKVVEAVAKQTAAKDITVWLPSTSVRVHLLPQPNQGTN